ncbi:MAG: Crp/Fnr family transcriptional regulator [Rhodospirillales bacterium]|nr:Crp/Fnr family transcriptional regulator [Rhodospirillales bacterium]
MDFGEAVQVLRSVPIFSKLDSSKLKLLAFACDYLTFDDCEVLFYEGEEADSAYLIDQGEVLICAGKADNEMVIGTLGRHELFGEMAIFRNSPRVATIRAKGQVKVLRVEGDMFLRMVTENPDTALGVMQMLSDKIARTTERFEVVEEQVRSLQSISDAAHPCAPAPVLGTNNK